jgi:hypothetical protein
LKNLFEIYQKLILLINKENTIKIRYDLQENNIEEIFEKKVKIIEKK